ncbi:MAG: hypothetical protein KGI25_07570 [Thaumarchaeota archaeon]|nr:hypothetical protein [Nitrososphaerota archaeon]
MVGFTPSSLYRGVVVNGTDFTGAPKNVHEITHPEYVTLSPWWYKWRLTYVGGEDFKRVYLKKYSAREDPNMFIERKEMTYIPAFAKTGINEIRNAIYQRLTDITRVTTSTTYNNAVAGKNGGVDRNGSTMEYFLGSDVLTELLVMGKVGVYVDAPNVNAANYEQSSKLSPYVYVYKAEQIRSWVQDSNGNFLTLLLEDVDYDLNRDYQLPIATTIRYRYYWIGEDGFVHCHFYDNVGQPQDDEIILGITEIPFHMLQISSSMMTEIADYQIALMNMASSDVQFSRLANYPLYVEKYNQMAELSTFNKSGTRGNDCSPQTDGSSAKTNEAHRIEKIGGSLIGRRFPQDVDYPEWVAPDTSSLAASMAKQEQMKQEIRTLLFLTLGNLQQNKQSADSKQQDISQEENGLSYIGFELALAENKMCQYWQAYEKNTNPFSIKYPQTFDIRTLEDRIDEATKFSKLVQLVPSITYKREMLKMVSKSLLGGRTPYELMEKINQEIDKTEVIVDPVQMALDIENRLVSRPTASKISGYPDGEVDKADKEAVLHAKEIMEAQTSQKPVDGNIENPAARGVPALSADPKADIKNDRNKNKKYTPRGEGKKPNANESVGTT